MDNMNNNVEKLTELNNVIESAATELQGIDIPKVESALPEIKNNNQVLSGVLIGFAGLGVIESCALAGFGVYKLVKHIKAQKARNKKAEEAFDELEDEFFDEDTATEE